MHLSQFDWNQAKCVGKVTPVDVASLDEQGNSKGCLTSCRRMEVREHSSTNKNDRMEKLFVALSGWCKTWTMDYGLDHGLDYGLDYALNHGLYYAKVIGMF